MQILLNSVLTGVGFAIGALVGAGIVFIALAMIGCLLGEKDDADN